MKLVPKLILVTPDPPLAGALAELLGEALEIRTASDLRQAASLPAADLIVLDSAAGKPSSLRESHSGPVIILGAMEEGADTALSKPFKYNELLRRVRLLLADASVPPEIGGWRFDLAGKQLESRDGSRTQALTEKEAEIIQFLLEAQERPVTREELLHEVWGYQAGISTHTLETHIYRLRQKIEKDPSDARILVTVPGGYQLRP